LGKHARIAVAAIQSGHYFETHPKNIAHIRDFLRFEVGDRNPDDLEKEMSKFEGTVADALRGVIASRRFDGDDRITILNLMSLLAVRSPYMREHWRQTHKTLMKRVMDLALATKERWDSQLRQMREAGRDVNDEITYDQIKDFHERGEYDVEVAREWMIGLELKMFEAVLPALVERKWKLYVTNERNGYFVTGDKPVILTWNEPAKMPPLVRHSPGFALKGTEVYFPISPEVAVVGSFEGEEEGTHEAPLELVALANLRVIEHTHEQVYTIRRTFPYIGPGLRLYHDSHFMERFAEAKRATDALKKPG
jgi:hypothetical protein